MQKALDTIIGEAINPTKVELFESSFFLGRSKPLHFFKKNLSNINITFDNC